MGKFKDIDSNKEENELDLEKEATDSSTSKFLFINNKKEYEIIDVENSDSEKEIEKEEKYKDGNSSDVEENSNISDKSIDIAKELDDIDISKVVKENKVDYHEDKNYKQLGRRKENSYIKRVIKNFVLLFIFVFLFSFSIYKAFDFNIKHTIKYNEGSNINYKVFLKENDFYDQTYLNKNMMYVANLVKNIEVEFNYNFSIDELSSMDFDYNIVGNLIIADELSDNTLAEKTYSLLEDKNIKMTNQGSQLINEKLVIDYDYYNEIANKFRMDYGIDTNSYLKVSLKLHKKSSKEISTYEIDDTKDMSIIIPLSEKAINIKIDSEEISGENKVISINNISKTNVTFIVLSLISFVIMMLVFLKLIRLMLLLVEKESKFDKYIRKLLEQYDRLIVETTHAPNFNDYNIIKISKFTELLDVRDNLKLPIMYYVVAKHHKSNFYIKHENDIYLFTVKETDI